MTMLAIPKTPHDDTTAAAVAAVAAVAATAAATAMTMTMTTVQALGRFRQTDKRRAAGQRGQRGRGCCSVFVRVGAARSRNESRR